MTSEPEEMRQTERMAQKLSADVAVLMLLHPRMRCVLRPIRRLAKWGEAQIDNWLKEEGWR